MKKTGGIAILAAILALTLVGVAKAEVVTTTVPLTTAAEVSPPVPLPAGAKGTTYLTINVIRDGAGNITGGIVNFLTSFSFPGAVTLTGHHIHEAAATGNGPIVIDPSLGGSTTVFPTGVGVANLTAVVTNTAVLGRLLANPAGFYVNLHTSVNPAGALRGQLRRLVETIADTVEMTLAEEVPLATNVSGIANGTITIDVKRNALGEVIGGTVTFTVNHDFVGEQRFSGLHIHEQVFGVAGPVRINTGISNNNLVIAPPGKGTINIPVEINATSLPPFQRLLLNPTGFYVNIHTTANPAGVVRGQLTQFSLPPSLLSASSYVIPAGGLVSTLTFSGYGLDAGTAILMNDQLTMTSFDPTTGELTAVVPSSLQASPGRLFVQARRSDGLRSLPLVIVVAAPASINSVVPVTTDGARFATTVAPDAISTTFGTRLSMATASATTATLPTVLDGSSVFVNGVISLLFYVSPGQINFQTPASTLPGTATVVVVARDGTVSRGTVDVATTISAIFTSRGNGTGAPAARASANGVNFNINMGTADGTPVAVDAGNFVMMFTTGLRFASALPSISIGGTAVTPMFAGAQGTFVSLDQVNFQIPLSLAGRGDVDLVMTVDGRTSNTVRLRIN